MIFYYPALNFQHCYPANGSRLSNAGSIYQTEHYNILYKKPIGILVLFYYPALNCKYCYPANGSRMTCLFSTHLEFSNKA